MEQVTLSSYSQAFSARSASKVTFSRDTLERKVQSQAGLGIGPGTIPKSVNLTVKEKFGDVGKVLERDAAGSEPALASLVNYHAKLMGASGRLFDQLVGKLCHLLKTNGKKLEMKYQDTIEALFCSIRTFIVDQEKSDLSRSRLIEILELKARHWGHDGEQPSEDSAPEDRQAEKLPVQDIEYPGEQATFYYRSGSGSQGRRYPSVEEIKRMALSTSLPDDSEDEEDDGDNDDQWQTTSYDSDSSEEFVMPAFGEIQDLMQESPSDLDDELARLLARSIPDSYKRRVNDGKPVRYTKAFLLNCWRSPFSKEMPPVLRHTIAHSDVAFIIQRHAFSDPKQLFTPDAGKDVLLFGCHLIPKKHLPKSGDKKWTQDPDQVSAHPSPHPSSTPGQPQSQLQPQPQLQPQTQPQPQPQTQPGARERILSWPQRTGPVAGGAGDSLGSRQKGVDKTRWDHDAFMEGEAGDPKSSRTRHQSGPSGERSRWDVLRASGDAGTPNSSKTHHVSVPEQRSRWDDLGAGGDAGTPIISRTRHVSVPSGQRSRWEDLGAGGDAGTPSSSRTRHVSGPSGESPRWDNVGGDAISRTRHLSGTSGQATQGAVGGVPKRMRHVSGEVKQLNEGHPRVTFSLPDDADEEAVAKAPKNPWKQVSTSANVIQESPGKEQMDVDPLATDQEQTKVEGNAFELTEPDSLTPEIHHPGIPTFREIFRAVIEKGRTANLGLGAQSGDDLRTPSPTDSYNLRPNYQVAQQHQQQQRQLPGAPGSRIGLSSGDRRTPSPDSFTLQSGGYQTLPGSRDNTGRPQQQQPEPLMQTPMAPPLQAHRSGWHPSDDWETPKGSGVLGAYPAGARQSLLGAYPGFMTAAPGVAHPSSSNLPYGMGAKIGAKGTSDSAYVPMAK